MNITEFNRNFIIQWHPSQKKKWKMKLIGFKKMKSLINDDAIFADLLKQAEAFTMDHLWYRVKNGLAFKLTWR